MQHNLHIAIVSKYSMFLHYLSCPLFAPLQCASDALSCCIYLIFRLFFGTSSRNTLQSTLNSIFSTTPFHHHPNPTPLLTPHPSHSPALLHLSCTQLSSSHHSRTHHSHPSLAPVITSIIRHPSLITYVTNRYSHFTYHSFPPQIDVPFNHYSIYYLRNDCRTAIGLRVKDGIVLGVEKIIVSKMLEPTSNRRVNNVDKHVGIV